MCFSWQDWFPSESVSQTLVSSEGRGFGQWTYRTEFLHLHMKAISSLPLNTEGLSFHLPNSKFYSIQDTLSLKEKDLHGNTNWCHSFPTLFGLAFTLCEDCLILDGFWGTDVLFVLQFVWPRFKHLLGAQSPMAPYWQHIESVSPHFNAPQYIYCCEFWDVAFS